MEDSPATPPRSDALAVPRHHVKLGYRLGGLGGLFGAYRRPKTDLSTFRARQAVFWAFQRSESLSNEFDLERHYENGPIAKRHDGLEEGWLMTGPRGKL